MVSALLAAGACDREPAAPGPTTVPSVTTAPAATTQPAEPVKSVVYIARPDIPEIAAVFPPAKMVLKEADGRTQASLFSIDPPEAIRDGYTGNTFFLELVFDAPLADVSGQEFVYLNSQNDRPDDDTGIFLSGRAVMLQPLEAAVMIEQIDGVWTASVAGTFQQFEQTSPDGPTAIVRLRSQMTPEVVIRK
jgi:hypothetical protein